MFNLVHTSNCKICHGFMMSCSQWVELTGEVYLERVTFSAILSPPTVLSSDSEGVRTRSYCEPSTLSGGVCNALATGWQWSEDIVQVTVLWWYLPRQVELPQVSTDRYYLTHSQISWYKGRWTCTTDRNIFQERKGVGLFPNCNV